MWFPDFVHFFLSFCAHNSHQSTAFLTDQRSLFCRRSICCPLHVAYISGWSPELIYCVRIHWNNSFYRNAYKWIRIGKCISAQHQCVWIWVLRCSAKQIWYPYIHVHCARVTAININVGIVPCTLYDSNAFEISWGWEHTSKWWMCVSFMPLASHHLSLNWCRNVSSFELKNGHDDNVQSLDSWQAKENESHRNGIDMTYASEHNSIATLHRDRANEFE